MSKHHLIPQQMIRRFAGDDGKLFELLKPSLAISTRKRSPSGILWREDYYVDQIGDLDVELLRGVEQRFARHFDLLAKAGPPMAAVRDEAAIAVIDWCASMLSRTRAYSEVTTTILSKENGVGAALEIAAPNLLANRLRHLWYEEWRDVLSRPAWRWKMIVVGSGSGFVLTDNPVLIIKPKSGSAFHLLAPLTTHRLLIGGPAIPNELRHDLVASLNLHLASWAHSRIYSSSRSQLSSIAAALAADTPWASKARQPLCGFSKRIMSSDAPPEGAAKTFWLDYKESLGPSRISAAVAADFFST